MARGDTKKNRKKLPRLPPELRQLLREVRENDLEFIADDDSDVLSEHHAGEEDDERTLGVDEFMGQPFRKVARHRGTGHHDEADLPPDRLRNMVGDDDDE